MWKDRQTSPLDDALVQELAKKYGKSSAQVILRWHLENELLVISKSSCPSRIEENFQIFDFSLDEEDLARMAELDRPEGRLGPNPETVEC